MLKEYAKTSPVPFFALPVLIIGLLILSFFLYSTLLNQQIDSRTRFLDRQVSITIQDIEEQVASLNNEIPNLSQIDNFADVFSENAAESEKLRLRLKRLVNKNEHFVDTFFIYNRNRIYLLFKDNGGEFVEKYDSLNRYDYPLQFSLSPKIVHLKGSKSLAIIPVQSTSQDEPIYVATLFDIFNLISSQSQSQFIGDYGYKMIFSENNGFSLAQKGSQVEYDFGFLKKHRTQVIDNLLNHEKGSIIHSATQQGHVFLTVYQSFSLFSERFGLIFSVSESDFIKPIKTRLQIIFLSFFAIIGAIIVVFVINLRDISKNTFELEGSREELAKALTLLEAQQESSKDALLISDRDGKLVSSNKRLVSIFDLNERPRKGIEVNTLLDSLSEKIEGKIDWLDVKSLEEGQKSVTLKSGLLVDFSCAPILDETLNNHGRIWIFRLAP
ncbi:MAG: hypothetical protein ACPGEG_09090 [Salibacteraceae bacterium]